MLNSVNQAQRCFQANVVFSPIATGTPIRYKRLTKVVCDFSMPRTLGNFHIRLKRLVKSAHAGLVAYQIHRYKRRVKTRLSRALFAETLTERGIEDSCSVLIDSDV